VEVQEKSEALKMKEALGGSGDAPCGSGFEQQLLGSRKNPQPWIPRRKVQAKMGSGHHAPRMLGDSGCILLAVPAAHCARLAGDVKS